MMVYPRPQSGSWIFAAVDYSAVPERIFNLRWFFDRQRGKQFAHSLCPREKSIPSSDLSKYLKRGGLNSLNKQFEEQPTL
jgi:hypothetical protein